MIIQNVVLPKNDISREYEMYYHSSIKRELSWPITLDTGESIDFTSFFNDLSLDKWLKYTEASNIMLSISSFGAFDVTIINRHLGNDDDVRVSKTFNITNTECVTNIPLGFDGGLVSFSITSTVDNCVINNISFTTDNKKEKMARLALNICTYKKENYVKKNINNILKLIDTSYEKIDDPMDIFVVDNGRTLDTTSNDDRVHIVHNRNAGGSGGFARGVIAISEYKKKFTRIIFMDDDAVIDTESLYRIWSFASLLKSEYQNVTIGGIMLDIDTSIVYESSASLEKNGIKPNDHGLDVSTPHECLLLNEEKESDYNGWWLCAIPTTIVNINNLPMPFFIIWDDAEYGLRNDVSQIININGISVWHEPFRKKHSPQRSYYHTRNWFALKSLNKNLHAIDIMHSLSCAMSELLCLHYNDADMILRGINDFLKGPKWLSIIDPEKINNELLEQSYDVKPIDASIQNTLMNPSVESNIRHIMRLLTLNGLFLPGKRDVIAPINEKNSSMFYRAKRALNIDDDMKYGFITEKDAIKSVILFVRVVKTLTKSLFNYKRVMKEYYNNKDRLSSHDFWSTYLGID